MLGSARLSPNVREIPGRSDAEKALAAAQCGGRRSFSFAAVFLVDEVPALLEEGQWRRADSAVMDCFLELSNGLRPADRIFRWTGSALVALMDRETSAEVEKDLSEGGFGMPAEIFPLSAHDRVAELSQHMDWHVATTLIARTKIPA